MNKNSYYLSLLILFSSISCGRDSNPVDPIVPIKSCDAEKVTQNYFWRIDTIGLWPTYFGGLHAFSDSNAFAMGYINGEYLGKHWDGKNWTTNLFGTPMEIGHWSEAVTGDNNLMVSVGSADVGLPGIPAIGEFNNNQKKWKKTVFQSTGKLSAVWTDQNGFYIAGGSNGFIVVKNSNSSEWQIVPSPVKGTISWISGINKDQIYLSSYFYNTSASSSTNELWYYNSGVWTKLYNSEMPDSSSYFEFNGDNKFQGFELNFCSETNELHFLVRSKELQFYFWDSKANRFKLEYPPYFTSTSRNSTNAKVFAPNDIWFSGNYYQHWDGKTVQRVNLPRNFELGSIVFKTISGKVFIPMGHLSGGGWIVAQGTPIF